jgi:hypothetical protein
VCGLLASRDRRNFWPVLQRQSSPCDNATPAHCHYLFVVHRCNWNAPDHVKQITFEQSAEVLAEVGKALIEHKLIKYDMLDEIVWAVRTRYARDLWDTPLSGEDCKHPAPTAVMKAKGLIREVMRFQIPPKLTSVIR